MDTVFATQDGNGGAAVKGGNHASQKFRRQFNKFAEARASMLTQVGMPKSIVMGVVSKNPALIEKVNSY